MPRKSSSIAQIIGKLREAEVLLSQGQTIGDICRSFNISEQTYYPTFRTLRTEQTTFLSLSLSKTAESLKEIAVQLQSKGQYFVATTQMKAALQKMQEFSASKQKDS